MSIELLFILWGIGCLIAGFIFGFLIRKYLKEDLKKGG